MTKPDDSSLNPEDLHAVEERARRLLDRASAWDRFPVPIDDILAAANVQLAPTSLFDPAAILGYLRGKAAEAGNQIKSAISKVFGIYDAAEGLIHIDGTSIKSNSKKTFLTLHETAHHDLPVHRKMFRFFQDCDQTLTPEIADQFEREANNFARFALFKGDTYARLAADCSFDIKTPIKLAKKFGASNYASAREFARTHHRACVVYILEPIEYVNGHGAQAAVRRIEPSPSFVAQFGRPDDSHITLDHALGAVLPLGRKMTSPRTLSIADRNGAPHECVAEAFDTTHNIIILLYPVQALGKPTIILPA
ncbi:ImmA/IrrE family metallo-endopeptidase [Mycoplana ramosa]|uniref:ImmA/IrrE family metallo-endopeptidase n=1 Tax=Mycoplana ramosa TaxID=40837 RepID=A0ABW3YYZ1_MYCRA